MFSITTNTLFYRQCENACKISISARYMQIFTKNIVNFVHFFVGNTDLNFQMAANS